MGNLRGHEGGTLISWLSTLGNYLQYVCPKALGVF